MSCHSLGVNVILVQWNEYRFLECVNFMLAFLIWINSQFWYIVDRIFALKVQYIHTPTNKNLLNNKAFWKPDRN